MSTLEGLSNNEVLSLSQQFGKNTLPSKEAVSWFSILINQFKSPLIYILLVVVIISAFLHEITDVALAAAVVVINVLMGFYQEYNAQKTLEALKRLIRPITTVIREGKRQEIDVKDLVPGDLVVISAGDKIPADGKLIEGVNLLVNESILTGEREAVSKSLHDENQLLFMGTTVLSGKGIIRVGAIGLKTRMGQIGESLTEIKETETPLQKKLEIFIKYLAWLILGVCFFIFIIGLIYGQGFWEMLRISVILAIAALPEGLPISITVILALGVRRILKQKGLVKKLLSIETLGSTSVICTDKTGTLTEGIMKITKTDFIDQNIAFTAMILNNEQKSNLEIALWDYVKKIGKQDPADILNKVKRIEEDPFDSEKKYSLTINEIENQKIAFILGAPEIVISYCHLEEEDKKNILGKFQDWAKSGLRVIAIATKVGENLKEKINYRWIGLVGINDPVRLGAKESIEIAQKAGIKIKIVTGDYRVTAEKITEDLGFKLTSDNVLEGKDLEVISDKSLSEKIENIILFTRVTPHQKLKIVRVLQEKGEVVAMTGDGVNDAPALKKADIGVVVGEASDVAKEAGDLILLDSNFKTIVAACEEGRLIFSNIKKVVGYILSNSFDSIILIFGAMLLGFPAPLTVVQILWVHLICDGPPDILLGFEPKEKTIMEEKPQDLKSQNILSSSMKFLIIVISTFVGLSSLFLFWYFYKTTGNLILAQTIAFANIGSVTLIYIFAYKNLKKSIFNTENFFKNIYLFLGVIYGWILLFIAIYVPFFNNVLKTTPLKPIHWLLILGISIFATGIVEIVKWYDRKRKI